MTAERWAQITSIFREALDQPPAARTAFLEGACGGDGALRRNVERLLSVQTESSLPNPSPGVFADSEFDLSPGEPVAQYRIEAKIGQGGMGSVYLAYDTKLQRKVALKVLSPVFLDDEERTRWLLREARAASALNHPNIVTVYETGTDMGIDFIAMEYVDGSPLHDLIPKGGLPREQLLKYALQAADAVAAAHNAGILHRDLKPSNIMVTRERRLKVLDFGLAITINQDAAEDGPVAGTAAYMSPEQAQGRKLDSRSDIFSFGTVLYEMATGLRPFAAGGRTGVLRQVTGQQPCPPGQLARLPAQLEKLILRCLAKDPSQRWQSMAQVKEELEGIKEKRPAKAFTIAAVAIAAALAIVLLAPRWRAPTAETAGGQTVKFTITPPKLSRGGDSEIDAEVSISPNGKHITYVAAPNGQLWVRDLDQENARLVPGATRVYQVFWSPDSRHAGYSAGLRDLMRIPLDGGTPQQITKLAGDFRRASWSSDGKTILYCDTTGLHTVPASGGTPTLVVAHNHIEHPSWLDLPGGRRAYLYQAVDDSPRHGIYVRAAGENRHRRIILSASSNPYPAYSPTGHIVYVDGIGEASAIWAVPFSLEELKATGKPFQVAASGSSPQVSATGTLVYSDVPPLKQQLTVLGRSGKSSRPVGEPRLRSWMSLSPDGRKLAVLETTDTPDIWIHDLVKGVRTRFTSDAAVEGVGSWSADGSEFVYSSNRGGNFDLYTKTATGDARVLLRTPAVEQGPQWSPDGKYLLYEVISPETKRDLVYRVRGAGGALSDEVAFVRTPADDTLARFSPDGRYVLYTSGASEIYVRDFPGGASVWRISADTGHSARWSRNGNEILYDDWTRIHAVSIATQPVMTIGKPQFVLEKGAAGRGFDVSADGQTFVTWARLPNPPAISIHIAHRWFEEFRAAQHGQ